MWTDVFGVLASAGAPPAQVLIDSSAVKAHRCAAGGKGGSAAKPLADPDCRPLAFLLSGGNVADCTAADGLRDRMPVTSILHGDKGYDSNAVRRKIENRGAALNIPPKLNRRWKNCFSPFLYGDRNAIERMFGRIKDFRKIATRYDKLAQNFLSAVCQVATGCYR